MQITLSKSQQEALSKVLAGDNMLITGAAGTGKSYVVKSITQALSKRNRRFALTSSTGVSAMNIGGRTIHSFLGTRNFGTIEQVDAALASNNLMMSGVTTERIQKVDVLIVDEVSMLTGDYIDMMDVWFRRIRQVTLPFGGVQMIFVGDFLQLPPVITGMDRISKKYAFQSDVWTNANIEIIFLSEFFRQKNVEFVSHLGKLRYGIVSQETIDYFSACVGRTLSKEPVRLFPKNADVQVINREKLDKIEGDPAVFRAGMKGTEANQTRIRQYCIAEEFLFLKPTARVIALVNDPHGEYVNGSLGTVLGTSPEGVEVKLDFGGKVLFGYNTWSLLDASGDVAAEMTQVPLKLAYALTIHKAQGMTLDAVQCDISSCFENGHAYVALSRVRDVAGLSLDKPMRASQVKACPQAISFYADLMRRV